MPGRSAVGLGLGLLVLGGSALSAAPPAPEARPFAVTEQRQACDTYTPLRRPFFGDTHVHTTHSQDASTQDTRLRPRDAYRFARGEPLGIQPHDDAGASQRTVALDRPLDFAMVTDHAEQIGEVHICKTPGAPGYDSFVCHVYRAAPRTAFYLMNGAYAFAEGRWDFCGAAGEHCAEAARTVWDDIRDAAEEAYDRSAACAFTSFVAYEWTAGGGAHLHRNVIFRNERVPALPISKMETGSAAVELWRRLDAECRDGQPGCEALTIPHNSNLSHGLAFSSSVLPGEPIRAEEIAYRIRYDRLVEVMQHKGDSECALAPGASDEDCGFESVAPAGALPWSERPQPAPVDYVRSALLRGLRLDRELGANPLGFGLIASTDTHLGTPGLVSERGHPGHGGAGKSSAEGVPPGLPDDLEFNPGGLAVLWAEENSRDALFEAMLRREAYGTSGTRPTLRFFGGWEYPDDLCTGSDIAAAGYAGGVPMGGVLAPAPSADAAPRFVLAALRDPLAAPLSRIEIVKGWLSGDALEERVIAVAGGASDADVDLATCEPRGAGHAQLCSVWSDPDFDPSAPAFYYARVLDNPTCRWSQWACVDAGVDCGDPSTITEGFESCCAPEHRKTIQERAWSSPIWYRP
jgi:hypothetical protein